MKKVMRFLIPLIFFMMLVVGSSTAIAASASVTTMSVGKTKTVSSYTVKSSNKKAVTVKKFGKKYKLVARRVGVTKLSYYKSNKLKKIVYVLVSNKNSFKYNTSNLSLKKGSSKKVPVTITSALKSKVKVSFATSNKKVATVNTKGVIKGVGKGTTTITVKIFYKNKTIKTFKKKVTVKVNGSSVTLRKISCSISNNRVYVGQDFPKKYITVLGIYSDGSKKEISNYSVSFTPRSTPGKATLKIHEPELDKDFSFTINVVARKDNTSNSSDTNDSTKSQTSIQVSFNKSSVDEDYKIKDSDFTVYKVYSDGSKELTDDFSYSGSYDPDKSLWAIKVISGKYTKTVTVKVNQSEMLVSADFALSPNWVYVGNDLALNQVKVKATFKKGNSTYTKYVTDYTTDFTPKSVPGVYDLNIKYKNSSARLKITVKSNKVSVTGYSVKYLKDYILLGDKPNKDYIEVIAKYSDGTSGVVSDFKYSWVGATKAGDDGILTVTIGDSSLKVAIPCYDEKGYTSIKVAVTPTLKVGESITKDSDLVVTAVTLGGDKVTVSDYDVSWDSKTSTGTYPLKISIKGYRGNMISATVNITVYD